MLNGTGFLGAPEPSADSERLFADDVDKQGFVMNLSQLWARLPRAHDDLFALMAMAAGAGALSFRQRAVLVTAMAAAFGDSYCALAWGTRLAGVAGEQVAVGVASANDEPLDDSERALARWARRVTRHPGAIERGDVQELRDAGFDDDRIFAITLFVALRICFAVVNDALGARPDRELVERAPKALLDAVSYGRPPAEEC